MPIIIDPHAPGLVQPPVFWSPSGRVKVTIDHDWCGAYIQVWGIGATKVTVTRDGQPVASGDPARVIGGYVIAYDPFGPLDADVVYKVAGDDGTSDHVSVHTANVQKEWTFITPLNDVTAGVCFQAVQDIPAYGMDSRINLNAVPGANLRYGSWDTVNASGQTWVWASGIHNREGLSLVERDSLIKALTQGPMCFRPEASTGFDYHWMMPGDVTAERMWPYWKISCPLTPIVTPSMVDLPLVIPGYSYNDVRKDGTYNDLVKVSDTYDLMIGITEDK